jgi:hypothetical protein
MSKKLYSTAKWKSHVTRAQERELANVRRRKNSGTKPHQAHQRPKTDTVTLTLPAVFSIVRNPEETIEFLRNVEENARRYHINFNLQPVTDMTIEAITALSAVVRRQNLRHTRITGNLPNDTGCQNILVQSGFFEHVRHKHTLPHADHGKMSHKESKKVDGKLAQELVHRVMSALYGTPKPCQPAYRALMESMSNTRDHAARTMMETETWWATAYADTKNKLACFAFLDTGVGIFKSVKLGKIRRAYETVAKVIGFRNDGLILMEILRGEVKSRTGLEYRGKGLPSMYNAIIASRLRSLIIVSNNVYANVGQGDFHTLKQEFRGTLLYWEV